MNADTPMFRQYSELKVKHPDALLFFRMGDFYELFFDDARLVAEQLGLTLTSRNKDDPNPVPMAGVPHHAAAGYIRELVSRGHKVAVADQVEDPREAKGIVRREVTRVITPGLGLDIDDLPPAEPCWLVGLARAGERLGVALLDASTGDLRVTEVGSLEAALEELSRAAPREAVLPQSLAQLPGVREALGGARVNTRDDARFEPKAARRALCARLGVADLRGFGCEDHTVSLAAAWALLDYAAEDARQDLRHVSRLRPYSAQQHMVLDAATRRNLELFRPMLNTGRRGTLIHLLDRTRTAMGGRLLREWLSFPLLDLGGIRARQDRVEALVEDAPLRRVVREALRGVADLERLAGKLAQGNATARDLVRLRLSVEALPGLVGALAAAPALAERLPPELPMGLAAEVARWLVDDPPLSMTEGGLIRPGADPELDELTRLAHDGKALIAQMEEREQKRTGITSLKIRYNRVFGYFIEISRANLHRAPADYIRKQTLTNAERYVTPELKEFEEKVTHADARREQLEYERFTALRELAAGYVPALQALASALAELDVFAALAELAADARYVRPEVDDSLHLEIIGGRHPVVEQVELAERFVPNDLALAPKGRRMLIITGPNMSGKSTVMRQAALITLMAQVGSFVPADKARIGVCDRIFTRVGASDDLAAGQSTFMVEMSETANILHHATERSFIILDEIGRGTSTYDGLAIAWSVAEALHDRVRARALFATHYHELVELAESRPHIANVSVAVSEWGERIVFLRRLKEGGASRSYGIQCARLAGMPKEVIERAKSLLVVLERHAASAPTPQLSLFGGGAAVSNAASTPSAPAPAAPDPLREALHAIEPDQLSPREALAALYRLQELARAEAPR